MQAIERIKDGWKQFRTCSSDDFAALIAHIDKLEAEVERLRKDAERYRWLKSAKRPNGRIVKQEKYMEDQEPTAIEACMACLSDDAAPLHSVNPEDEVADNMLRAETLMGDMARLLEEVRRNFTREDDLPDGLLGRIDAVLDAV